VTAQNKIKRREGKKAQLGPGQIEERREEEKAKRNRVNRVQTKKKKKRGKK
jgi:hypothetical protein